MNTFVYICILMYGLYTITRIKTRTRIKARVKTSMKMKVKLRERR